MESDDSDCSMGSIADEPTASFISYYPTPTTAKIKEALSQTKEKSKEIYIPVLSSNTSNPDTYDLDMLLSSFNQKFELSGHRFNDTKSANSHNTQPTNNVRCQIPKEKFSVNEKITKKSNRKPEELAERFQKYVDDKKNKQSFVGETADFEISKICTFTPETCSRKKKRSQAEFLALQEEFLKKRDSKIQFIKEQKQLNAEPEVKPKKPEISKGSQKILSRIGHRSESQNSKSEKKTEVSEGSFKPKINANSKRIAARTRSSNSLLLDSNRRLDHSQSLVEQLPPQNLPSQKNSGVLLRQKFINAFWNVCKIPFLDFDQFHEILQNLQYCNGWNFHEEIALLWSYASDDEGEWPSEELLGLLLLAENLVDDPDRGFSSQFRQITTHRKQQAKSYKKEGLALSFQPSLNSRSQKLCQKMRYSPREGITSPRSPKCTSPRSSRNMTDPPKPRSKSKGDPERLKQLYEQAQKRVEKQSEKRMQAEAKEQKLLENTCTFAPQITKTKQVQYRNVKGLQSTVDRMQKARKDRQEVQNALEKGSWVK